MNAHGGDFSAWQDDNTTPQPVDFAKAKAAGMTFAGIKISQANWADPDYSVNWANAKKHLYRMPYHFLTWTTDPKRQAEVFWSLLEKDTYALLPLICDFEWWSSNLTPLNAMDILYNFMERMRSLSSPLPLGIYTAKTFWDPNGSIDLYWTQYYLWLCDIAGEVPVPLPWTKWTFWQYTFKLHGPTYGAESLDLDGDRYNGTLEQMKAEFRLPDIGLEIPVPPPPVVNEIKYRVLRNMNIRAGASTAYADIGDLKAGDIVTAEDFGGNNLWIKIGVGEWAAVRYNGIIYMERI